MTVLLVLVVLTWATNQVFFCGLAWMVWCDYRDRPRAPGASSLKSVRIPTPEEALEASGEWPAVGETVSAESMERIRAGLKAEHGLEGEELEQALVQVREAFALRVRE